MDEKYSTLTIVAVKKIADVAVSDGEDAAYEFAFDTYGPWASEWFGPIIHSAINGTIDYTVRNYYRIGEPRIAPAGCLYAPSYNFADEKYENGVSAISIGWLHSLKSVFWNADERAKTHGVWKISGIQLSAGGDDEPVIYPLGWADKTKLRSVSGIEKALKAVEK